MGDDKPLLFEDSFLLRRSRESFTADAPGVEAGPDEDLAFSLILESDEAFRGARSFELRTDVTPGVESPRDPDRYFSFSSEGRAVLDRLCIERDESSLT